MLYYAFFFGFSFLLHNIERFSKKYDAILMLIYVRSQLIEVVSVTSEYPQDGGWGALLLRLLRLRVIKIA